MIFFRSPIIPLIHMGDDRKHLPSRSLNIFCKKEFIFFPEYRRVYIYRKNPEAKKKEKKEKIFCGLAVFSLLDPSFVYIYMHFSSVTLALFSFSQNDDRHFLYAIFYSFSLSLNLTLSQLSDEIIHNSAIWAN